MSVTSVQVLQTWTHKKKDNLGELLRRAMEAANAAALGPPELRLLALDSAVGGGVSAVARAVRKYPELTALQRPFTPPGAAVAIDSISTQTAAGNARISLELLLGVADGVPRSLPFHQVTATLAWPEPGGFTIRFLDNWWVSGRMRSSALTYSTEADPAARKPPPPPAGVQAILDAFGKPKTTMVMPTPGGSAPPVPAGLREIVHQQRAQLVERIAAARLPHALETTGIGEAAGPMKPLLVERFGPRGFDCQGGHGTFCLRRRTPANHVVEISLDVGSWSHLYYGYLAVHGPGFRATVPLPVAGTTGQIPIRGAEGWRKIVENLAVVVGLLEEEFVPKVEGVAGSAPAWFEPPPL